MGKTLIAYYSWTGHTAKVATALAQKLSADLEAVNEEKSRGTNGWAYFCAAMESLFRRRPSILASLNSPSRYDLVILGTPVWAGQMAPPMRSYILQHQGSFQRIALFCTQGGAGGDKVLEKMAGLCGRSPAARLVVSEPQIQSGEWQERVAAFASELTG